MRRLPASTKERSSPFHPCPTRTSGIGSRQHAARCPESSPVLCRRADTTSGPLRWPEHDMTSFIKAAGLAVILVVVFATVTPDLKAAQLNTAVRERQAVVTELGANASAITYWVSESDGWHVVTTVDTVIRQDRDAEKHAVVRFSSVRLPAQSPPTSVPFATAARHPVLP